MRDLSHRRISAILYLNPGWQPADDGKLVLFPFPFAPVPVEPVNDRLVLFSSPYMLHRVTPSMARQRFCLTIWFSGQPLAAGHSHGNDTTGPSSAQPSLLKHLLARENRKHVSKLIYANEWSQSIIDSHPPGPERQHVLDTHWADVKVIEKVFGPRLEQLKATGLTLPLPHSMQELEFDVDWGL